MENKYYTPEIEDLRIGYELEVLRSKGWSKFTLVRTHLLDILTEDIEIPTPYLTKEQIENEGWILRSEGYSRNFYEKGEESLLVHHVGHWIIITDLSEEQIYKGDCKSINEFRTIMKLLNIK